MKKIVLSLVFCFSILILKAQQVQETPEVRVAHKIANKMADSLQLTNQQRTKIFNINMELSRQKKESRKKSTDRAVVGAELQKIESTRDGMYKTVLTAEQYVLYKQKKRNLVNNN